MFRNDDIKKPLDLELSETHSFDDVVYKTTLGDLSKLEWYIFIILKGAALMKWTPKSGQTDGGVFLLE